MLLTGNTFITQSIVINEIQVSNKKTISDGFGEFDDWIEIYNSSNKSVDLTGMFLTDDLSNPTKHQISSSNSNWVTIEAHNYLLESPMRKKLTKEYFCNSVINSDILSLIHI